MMNEGKMSRRTWHRLYVAAVAVLIAAAILFMNLAGSLLENKFNLSADFSRSAVFTLSEETLKMISDLDEDVLLYAVYKNNAHDVTVEQMLKAYDRASGRIVSRVLDPVDDVEALLPFTKDGTTVTSGSMIVSNAQKDRFIVLDYYDFYIVGGSGITGIQGEQSISSAILHLTRSGTPRVIFMNAHGDTSIASVPAFATHLVASGYELFQSQDVFNEQFAGMLNPELDILVYNSPNTDLEDAEADVLADYVKRGGHVLFYMDYSRSVDNDMGISLTYAPFVNFNRLFEAAGMQLNSDLILVPEEAANLGSITRFNAAVSDESLLKGDAKELVFSECASISVTGTAQPLATSPDAAYGKQIKEGMQSLERQEEDSSGSHCVCAAGGIGEGRIVLFGTSSVLQSGFGLQGNREFAVRLMNAVSGESENPVIPPVTITNGKLRIQSVSQQVMLIVFVVGVLPLAVLLAGVCVLWRRRMRTWRVKHD